MPPLLVDTDILVDLLRNFPPAVRYLDSAFERREQVMCSTITKAEIYAGFRSHEEVLVAKLEKFLKSIHVSDEISRLAGAYIREFSQIRPLELGDALIAATAKISGAILVTRNIRDFPMKDISIVKPY